MPQLHWDETDFLECLEVLPVTDEYGIRHIYKVHQAPLCLTVIVRQLESLVFFSLEMDGHSEPLIEFPLVVRGKVRYIRDKRGTFLEFQDAVLLAHRFELHSASLLENAVGDSARLGIKPAIRLWFESV